MKEQKNILFEDKLGVIVALDYELDLELLISSLKLKLVVKNNFKYYQSETNGWFNITFSGVGKVNAALAASNFLHHNISNIINIGSCGIYHLPEQKQVKPELFLIDKYYYFDVDVTAFKHAYGQIPNLPLFFEFKNKFQQEIKTLLQIKDAYCGNIATGDRFIKELTETEKKWFDQANINFIDMEAAAIAQVMHLKENQNFCALKVTTDNVKQKNNHQEYNKQKEKVQKKITTTIEKIFLGFKGNN